MTIAVANVANTDTFGSWLTKTNTLLTIVSQNAVTVDTTFSGSLSTGNGYVNGYFGANTLLAYTGIAGGTLTAGNTLNLLTNTAFVYSGSNLASFNANSTYSNAVITTNSIYLVANGGNVTIGGYYLNLIANVINVSSGSFNYNGISTFTGNTIFKSNTTFAVLSITGNNSDVTVLANTTNTTFVGNTTFANSVLIKGLANVNQLNISGNVTSNIAGNLRIEGSISVGGNLAYSGTTGGDIIPGTNNFFNLGNTTNRWNYIYSNNIISNNANIVNLNVSGNTNFTGGFAPTSNNSSSLGNTTSYWSAVYASNTYSNNVIVSNNLYVPAGSVSAPSITFTGNTDTGIYRPANATVGITAGGLQILSINTTAVAANVTITAANTITITGNATFSNVVTVTGNATFSNVVTVAGVITLSSNAAVTGRVILNSIGHQFANSYTFLNNSTAANIDVVSASLYRSFEYMVQLVDSTITPNPYYHSTKISILHDNTIAYITEYGTLFNSVSLGSFDVLINGGNIGLQLTPTTANVVVKFIRTSIVQ